MRTFSIHQYYDKNPVRPMPFSRPDHPVSGLQVYATSPSLFSMLVQRFVVSKLKFYLKTKCEVQFEYYDFCYSIIVHFMSDKVK